MVRTRISKGLRYSSLCWIDHVLQVDDVREIQDYVAKLLHSPKALFWIEILSLLGLLERGKEILLQCASHFKDVSRIVCAVTELLEFITTFHRAIDISTPHLYLCAFIWLPPDSIVARHLRSTDSGRLRWKWTLYDSATPCTYTSKTKNSSPLREANALLLKGDTPDIVTTKYTPDRRKIVSSTHDGTVQIWDVESGEAISEPFESHISRICALAYSPNSSQIASGSDEGKLRVWNANTGTLVVEQPNAHKGWINAIAYSRDGTRIVSGSDDGTLRLWNARNDKPIGAPLKCCGGRVISVAFGPGKCDIVSGSDDGTVWLWSAPGGTIVGRQLKGHVGKILTVAYAPDGNKVVSGSSNNTLQIWDVQSGTLLGGPLRDHNDSVRSAAYSPDGTRIVSGSDDQTLRIWDARSGRAIGEPLKGHTGTILSVAYSLDGSNIISASADGTVRTWDAKSGVSVSDPLNVYENTVGPVRTSPDGNRIALGSEDGTIRIWDAHSRALLLIMAVGLNGSRWDPHKQGFLTISGDGKGSIERIETTDDPLRIPSDGWLRTLDGNLYLWVPLEQRARLCTTGQVCIPNNKKGWFKSFVWSNVCYGKDRITSDYISMPLEGSQNSM